MTTTQNKTVILSWFLQEEGPELVERLLVNAVL